MGASSSKTSTSNGSDDVSGAGVAQLYVSLRLNSSSAFKVDLVPHVYGSNPIIGSWDPTKALPMERESASTWELSFVVPANHDMLDFKFLLKPKNGNAPCVVEEGPVRLLKGGELGKDSRAALFPVLVREGEGEEEGEEETVVEYKVLVDAVRISPFDLAASWRSYQENLEPSTVRGIPDVSINSVPEELECGQVGTLELDLEHYEVPTPLCSAASGTIYAANLAEDPRSFGGFSDRDSKGSKNYASCFIDRAASTKLEAWFTLTTGMLRMTTVGDPTL